MDENAQSIPERCELHHKVFTTLGEVCFRCSGQDGLPVMALNMGEREASIPVPSLRREFKIGSHSPDGRMLDLIGTSLDFISVIQPGDKFPPEIRTGEASWRPTPIHLRLAAVRLKLDLVAWRDPSSHRATTSRDAATLLRLSEEAAFAVDVATAAGWGARDLGMRGPAELLKLIDDLSAELSYIEALRERLLTRVEQLGRRLARLRVGVPQMEILSQVNRLLHLASRQIRSRFDEVDSQTGEVSGLFRNAESQRGFIRSNRDWLYRSQRAWQPPLDQWDRARDTATADIADLLGSTYQFLAPRFMPTTEWLVQRGPRRQTTTAQQMEW